jgi:Methyltransferase domain
MRDIDIIKRTVEECRKEFQDSPYYEMAEPYMERLWPTMIWPLIKDSDFSKVLELAPGWGRNTAHMINHAGEIHLVDLNQTCIDHCRARFKEYTGPCQLHYYVNDGYSLSDIGTESISFIYSFDSMVHFDKLVIKEYIKEFSRVLIPGGKGFVHHSNYGYVSQNSDWLSHPGYRTNVTQEMFAELCEEHGLTVDYQQVIDWGGVSNLDCLSLFQKKSQGSPGGFLWRWFRRRLQLDWRRSDRWATKPLNPDDEMCQQLQPRSIMNQEGRELRVWRTRRLIWCCRQPDVLNGSAWAW